MNSKVVSFQIVQGFAAGTRSVWKPDLIALCEDGSLWICGLSEFERGYGSWKRMTPELPQSYPDSSSTEEGQSS